VAILLIQLLPSQAERGLIADARQRRVEGATRAKLDEDAVSAQLDEPLALVEEAVRAHGHNSCGGGSGGAVVVTAHPWQKHTVDAAGIPRVPRRGDTVAYTKTLSVRC